MPQATDSGKPRARRVNGGFFRKMECPHVIKLVMPGLVPGIPVLAAIK
jgi:hypothetical protein